MYFYFSGLIFQGTVFESEHFWAARLFHCIVISESEHCLDIVWLCVVSNTFHLYDCVPL